MLICYIDEYDYLCYMLLYVLSRLIIVIVAQGLSCINNHYIANSQMVAAANIVS